MSEKLDRIETKVDKVLEEISEIKVIQGMHDVNLQDHMRRSENLEERTDILFAELEPLKSHVNQVVGVYKFFGALGILATILGVVLKFLHKV